MSDKLQKLTIRDLQEFREIKSTDDKDFEEIVEVLRKKHGVNWARNGESTWDGMEDVALA